MTYPLSHTEIRAAVTRLCADFPGSYWRGLDRDQAYPDEFVAALTREGYLGALVPEEFGGSGLTLSAAAAILEEIHHSGGNAAACHAQMYTMGSLVKSGSVAQKAEWLPKIASGEIRLQAFGVSEPNSGTDTLSLETTATLSDDGSEYIIRGQKMWTSRALRCVARISSLADDLLQLRASLLHQLGGLNACIAQVQCTRTRCCF